jgi:hypothetical protein
VKHSEGESISITPNLRFFKDDKNCGFLNVEMKDEDASPDWNDILLGCGRSEAETVTQKIQWKAGKSSKKNPAESIHGNIF